jgi:hypothetical protein
MAFGERVTYALISAVFGALVGVVCWWLYGLAHSLNYNGPGMDPVLQHWLTYVTSAFAVAGFVLRERSGDIAGDTLTAIFHFEMNDTSGHSLSVVASIVLLVIIIAAVWFTAPS